MSKQLHDIQHVTTVVGDFGDLGGLSLAELEYAWKYYDYLMMGDDEPSGVGFDPERIAKIRSVLDELYREHLRSIRGSGPK